MKKKPTKKPVKKDIGKELYIKGYDTGWVDALRHMGKWAEKKLKELK